MNPYTPPRDEGADAGGVSSDAESTGPGGRRASKPALPLFSPNQVFAASFCGLPIVFSLLLAANYRRRGFPLLAFLVIALGAVTTCAGLVLVKAPTFGLLAGALTFSAWFYSRQDEEAFESHIAGEGAQEGWLRWFFVCAGVVAAVLVFAMAVAMIQSEL